MVTLQEVKTVRKFLNKFNSTMEVSISDDVINAIENMCVDYELKYDGRFQK